MSSKETHPEAAAERHLGNVAENLQLVADLGYGDVSLATPLGDGVLQVAADARPMTAIAAVASSRVGVVLRREDELEAYQALAEGAMVVGARRRVTRGIAYTTIAYPVSGPTGPIGVIVRDIALQVAEAPGKMEQVFMAAAEELLGLLAEEPLLDVHTREPFSTMRVAGDGLLMIDEHGGVAYASPNAVNIMRVAGLEGTLTGANAERLPGAATSVMPVLSGTGATAVEIAAGGRVLGYR
ncbi:MAG: histidine kinase N-terminal domain-containing protein, partial [Actinomycetota bacterium]|nr:histidine kinase N-terminal domain-containing protein [Actinomycetota bacterium]